jgi:hypothetical protein
MELWVITLVVAGAGAVGGLGAALVSEDKGFRLPAKFVDPANPSSKVWRPGWIGLIFIGALAAVVSWGLYGDLAQQDFFGGGGPNVGDDPAEEEDEGGNHGITLSALVGAVLVGMGGSKFLSTQVDKKLLENTATAAAAAAGSSDQANPTDVTAIKQAIDDNRPAVALQTARRIQPPAQ